MNLLPVLSALLSLTVSLVSAQEYNTSAPFVLKLDSADADVSGQYLSSCHAGAAIEQLCLSGTDAPTDDNYGTYTLNVSLSSSSGSAETYETGPLVWILPTTTVNVSSGLVFAKDLTSNIAVPMFEPSSSGSDYVGFDADDKLFVYSGYYDQSTFVAGTTPKQVTPEPLYHVSLFFSFPFFLILSLPPFL